MRLQSGEIGSCGCAVIHRNTPNKFRDEIIDRRITTNDSTAEIARFYGVTKNTVIGILDRVGMIGDRMARGKSVAKKPIVFPGPNGCMFPFGDPGTDDFHFCGARIREGSSYCGPHHGRVYIPPENPRIEKVIPITAAKTVPDTKAA